LATSDFAGIGAREHFAVAAPEAMIPVRVRPEWPEGRAWNVPGVPLTSGESSENGPDDVAFVEALISSLVAAGIADEQRVYLAGFSGGGRLCSHLAGIMPERIAAIGTVAGLRLPPPCVVPPPPIIAFHSRSDEVNPYRGGAGLRWDIGVEETEAAFAQRYALSGPAIDTTGGAIRHVYCDRDARDRLITYTLEDRMHGWYGSRDPTHAAQYGTGDDTIDASALIWDFFRGVGVRRDG
jgi:polyhydroxybutyrate depolymerase